MKSYTNGYVAHFFLQYFKRDADELEGWIYEKLQAASDESYKDPTNLQAKIQKHQAFEAEVAAHSNAIVLLDNTGSEMIAQHHFSSDVIRKRLGKRRLIVNCVISFPNVTSTLRSFLNT